MIEYQKKKGIGTFSALIQKSFEIQEKIFPLESLESETTSLYAKLESIEKELKELRAQKELIQKQNETTSEQMQLLQEQEKALEQVASEQNFSNSSEIEEKVFEAFKRFNSNKIKDFVLMGELRAYSYKDSLIWATLVRLKEEGKLKLENGEWKL